MKSIHMNSMMMKLYYAVGHRDSTLVHSFGLVNLSI